MVCHDKHMKADQTTKFEVASPKHCLKKTGKKKERDPREKGAPKLPCLTGRGIRSKKGAQPQMKGGRVRLTAMTKGTFASGGKSDRGKNGPAGGRENRFKGHRMGETPDEPLPCRAMRYFSLWDPQPEEQPGLELNWEMSWGEGGLS